MTVTNVTNVPKRLGTLSDSVVARFMTPAIQSGSTIPGEGPMLKFAREFDGPDSRWLTAPVRDLVKEAQRRFEGRAPHADAWMAPRLHATLRITRAEAADSAYWNYLALLVAPDYVFWRHRSKNKASGKIEAPIARYSGYYHTQTFSRLWWMAELFRNGADYGPVEFSFKYQELVNTALRSSVIDHRPTALALIRTLEQLSDHDVNAIGDLITPLVKAVNAAASTIVFDVLAPDGPVDDVALMEWIAESEDMAPVPWDRLPEGPADCRICDEQINSIIPMFNDILEGVERRIRRAAEEDAAGFVEDNIGLSKS